MKDNLGWESTGVLEDGTEGLSDQGGNKVLDPRFEEVGGRPYVPTAPDARGYGHTALPPG